MRIFGLFEGERVPLELPEGVPVKEIKELIWKLLHIPEETGKQDKKVMVLSYAGSNLQDPWIFSDLGIRPGVTVKVSLQEEVKAVLFVQCAYSRTTINMYRNAQVAHMPVSALKIFVSKESGLPVGVFRLMTRSGKELFDSFQLEDYGVDVGHTVLMVTWDGWNDFLNLAVMGYTSHVMSQLFREEAVARYQMRVAMYIAAHYGHVDLARTLLEHPAGIRPDEPIGDHPTRQWCSENSHIDSLKTAVHEAVVMKQLRVLRIFVNHNVACIMARDGNGSTPMNIALRVRAQNIVQYLITKQWTKMTVDKTKTISVSVYCAVKRWCDRAKEKVFLLKGTAASSLKRRPFIKGALVTNGVIVDGFSRSQMNAGRKPPTRDEGRKHREFWKQEQEEDPEDYFKQMQMLHSSLTMMKTKRGSRWGKMADKARISIHPFSPTVEGSSPESKSSTTPSSGHSRIEVPDIGGALRRLPPIKRIKGSKRILSQNNLSPIDNSETGSIPETISSKSIMSKTPRKNFIMTKKRGKLSAFSVSAPNIRVGRADSTSPSKTALGSSATFRSPAKNDDIKSKLEDNEGRITYREAKRMRKKARTVTSAILLSKSKTTHGSLPLPVLNYNDTAHPKFYYKSQEGDIAKSTLALYEKYRGMKPRDYAIHCLTIADSFKEKPWLERVRMAVTLNAKNVKRNWDLDGSQSYRSDVTTGPMTNTNSHW